MIPPDDLYLEETPEDRERESLAEVTCLEHERIIICAVCGAELGFDE